MVACRIDTYPRTFFKLASKSALQASNNARLCRRWGTEGPDLEYEDEEENAARKVAIEFDLAPDYDLTTEALNLLLDRENHLDSSNQATHTFRLNMINLNLQTMEKLTTYKFWIRPGNQCVMCENEPETFDHIFECREIGINYEKYIVRTRELMYEEYKKRCSRNKTQFTEDIQNDIDQATSIFFHLDEDHGFWHAKRFLSSTEAKGVITPQSARKFEEMARNSTHMNKLYTTTVAAWTRSLFEIWWRPRSTQIYKEQRKAEKDRKKQLESEKRRRVAENREATKQKQKLARERLKKDRAEKAMKEKERIEAKRKAKNQHTEIHPITKKQRRETKEIIKKTQNKPREAGNPTPPPKSDATQQIEPIEHENALTRKRIPRQTTATARKRRRTTIIGGWLSTGAPHQNPEREPPCRKTLPRIIRKPPDKNETPENKQ
jgi:hypothetical protein